jgi:hypothetical protein
MSRTSLLLASTIVSGLLMIPQQPTIKRLDGSTIAAAEIDATIVRLCAPRKLLELVWHH